MKGSRRSHMMLTTFSLLEYKGKSLDRIAAYCTRTLLMVCKGETDRRNQLGALIESLRHMIWHCLSNIYIRIQKATTYYILLILTCDY